MARAMKYVDLFAGAGGLSEGFIRAGYKPIAHVEYDEAACYTLKTRVAYHWLKKNNKLHLYNDYLYGKISRVELYAYIPTRVLNSVIHEEIKDETLASIFDRVDKLLKGAKLDLIVGGPPCQAYSLVGRARDKNGMKGDPRNYLFKQYAKFLKRYEPQCFVFENVIGLLSAKDFDGELYLDKMRAEFKSVGYEIDFKVVSAKDFGVLQHRKRIIIIGKRGGDTDFFPKIKNVIASSKVKEALLGLPKIKAGEGILGAIKLGSGKYDYLSKHRIINRDVPVTLHSARPHNKRDLAIYTIAANKLRDSGERLNYNDLPSRLKTHKNRKSFLDRFKVVCWESSYSHTVEWKTNSEKIFSHVAATQAGFKHAKSFPDRAMYDALSGLFTHYMEALPVDSAWENTLGSLANAASIRHIESVDGFKMSCLNSFLHIDMSTTLIGDERGVVRGVSDEALATRGCRKKSFLGQMIPFLSDTSSPNKIAAREAIQIVGVEISAACDYSQDKNRLHKYVLGAIVPKSFEDLIDESKRPDSSVKLITYFSSISNSDETLWINLNFVVGEKPDSSCLTSPLFRLKKDLVNQLANRYANHISRIGITSF